MLKALALAVVVTASAEAEGESPSSPKVYPQCGRSVRKAWEAMGCQERTDYLSAVRALKDDDDLYGDFAEMHFDNNIRAHSADMFLPWHRWFLWTLEKELQRVSQKCVTVPYWAWENDISDEFQFASGRAGTAAEYTCGTVWSNPANQGFCADRSLATGQNGDLAADACCACGGGNTNADGVCTDKTYSSGTIPAYKPNPAIFSGDAFGSVVAGCPPDGVAQSDWIPRNPDEQCLRREFNSGRAPTTNAADLALMILNNPQYSSFRQQLEGTPHARPHIWGGGSMSTHYSPDDPLFFLHHANIDRLWALWQDVHDGDLVNTEDAGEDQYSGPCNAQKCNRPATADVGLDAPMPFVNPLRVNYDAPGRTSTPTPRDMLASFDGMVNVTYSGDEIAFLLQLQGNYNLNTNWVEPAPYIAQPPADGSCTADGVLPPKPDQPEREPVCVDRTALDGLSPWHDATGSQYTCDWYADSERRCAQYGASDSNFGYVANAACCTCGGGTTESRRRSTGSHHAGPLFRSTRLSNIAASVEKSLHTEDLSEILEEMHTEKCRDQGDKLLVPFSWIHQYTHGMIDHLEAFRC